MALDCQLCLEFGVCVCVCVCSEEIMLTLGESPSRNFRPMGFSGIGESFHWHGVVVEFIANWQPRCSTGNGCVHVSNLPMQVAYPADTSSFSTTSVR